MGAGPVMVAELEADLGEVELEFGTDQDTNTSGTFTDVNPETRRPDRPVPPRSGRLFIGWPPQSRRAGTCPR